MPAMNLANNLPNPRGSFPPQLGAGLETDHRLDVGLVFLDDLGKPLDHAAKFVLRKGFPQVEHGPLDQRRGEQVEVGEFQIDDADVGIDLRVDGLEPLVIGPLLEREQFGRFAGAAKAAEATVMELSLPQGCRECFLGRHDPRTVA